MAYEMDLKMHSFDHTSTKFSLRMPSLCPQVRTTVTTQTSGIKVQIVARKHKCIDEIEFG